MKKPLIILYLSLMVGYGSYAQEITAQDYDYGNTQLTARSLNIAFTSGNHNDLLDRPLYFSRAGENAFFARYNSDKELVQHIQNILKEASPHHGSMNLIPIEGGFIYEDYGFIEFKLIQVANMPYLLIVVIQPG